MIPFPIPRPDELLYGVCARLARVIRPPSLKSFTEQLFGENAIAVVDMPSRLHHLANTFPTNHPSPPARLLQENTTLPMYLPFLPTERAEKCRQAALGSGGKGLPFLTGIMGSRLSQPKYLRICPQCAKEDTDAFGEAHWHRSHQIVCVLACHTHHCQLIETQAKRGARKNRHEFIPVPQKDWGLPNPMTDPGHHRLAEDIHWLLNENQESPGLEKLQKGYADLLIEKRFAHPSGNLYLAQLVESFTAFHGAEFLQKINCDITNPEQNWLADLGRRRIRSPHPIQHILLIHFLGFTTKDFFQTIKIPSPTRTRIPVCKPKAQREDKIDSAELTPLWSDLSLSLREISRQLAADPMTVKRAAIKIGLEFPRKTIRPTRKPKFQKPGCHRLLAYHQHRWEKCLKANPHRITKRMHSSYAYLRRHARPWYEDCNAKYGLQISKIPHRQNACCSAQLPSQKKRFSVSSHDSKPSRLGATRPWKGKSPSSDTGRIFTGTSTLSKPSSISTTRCGQKTS